MNWNSGINKWVVFIGILLILWSTSPAVTYNVTGAGSFQSSGFNIGGLQLSPDRIYPGDQVRMRFSLENLEAQPALDVQLTALVPFLDSKSTIFIGTLSPGEPKQVTIDFTVPSSTKPGNYIVPVYVVDQKGFQSQVGEVPLVINEQALSNALIASLESPLEIYMGEETEMTFSIRNVGALRAEDVLVQLQYSATGVFLPIGTDRAYVPSIAAGGEAKVKFKLAVNAGTSAGFYPLTFIINYKVDKVAQTQISQTAGVKAIAKTELLVSSEQVVSIDGSPSITVTIANTGDTAVRGVYAKATSSAYRFSGVPDKFIGTLNLDDSATMTLTAVPLAAATGARTITIEVTYKDAVNNEHTQTKEINLAGELASDGMHSGTANGVSDGTQAATTQRFVRRQQDSGPFGFSWLVIGGGALLLIAAFFAHKWMRRRKK